MDEAQPTRDARVMGWFGGEERAFRLLVPFLAKVQDDTGVGPGVVIGALARLVQMLELRGQAPNLALAAAGLGDWKVEYITRPIFWGLVGAGMGETDAGKLVRRHINERGFAALLEYGPLALEVMVGGAEGPAEDTAGEPVAGAGAKAAPSRSPRSRTAASASPSSTPTPPSRASRPPPSTSAASGRSPRRSKASAGPTSPKTAAA